MTPGRGFLRWLAVVAVLLVCVLLDRFRPGPPTRSTLHVPALAMGIPGAAGTPIAAGRLPPWKDTSSFVVEFRARAASDAYVNFFQTSGTTNALRMELVQPGKLQLALTDSHYLLVTDAFTFTEWHTYRVRMDKGRSVEVAIDGKVVQQWTGAPAAPALALDDLVVGAGFDRQRPFAGEIRDFRMAVDHLAQRPAWQRWAMDLTAWLAIAMLLAWSLARRTALVEPAPTTSTPGVDTAWAWAAASLAFGAAGWWAYSRAWPPGKWILLLAFAPLFALPLLPAWRLRGAAPVLKVAAAAAALAYVVRQLAGMPDALWVAAASLAAAAACYRFAAAGSRSPLTAAGAGLAFAVCWLALASTPGLQALAAQAQLYPATVAALLAGLAVPLAFRLLQPRPDSAASGNWPRRLLSAWPFLLFALLALRNDALDVGGAEMHWEYFAGPIRAVRNGGWLLWDTPSQYGFLNVLLASLVPATSEWQALYLFQAFILFCCATLCFATFNILVPGRRVAMALLAALAFFYADPALIGPAPYPSSSGMRFLWVYALLYCVADSFLRRGEDAAGFVRRAAIPWLLGVLWSGESAVYATTIYLAAPLAMTWSRLLRTSGRQEFLLAIRALLRSVALLAACVAAIALVYRTGIGHWPDLRMHVLYSTAYAKGFGELPVPWAGPLWLIGLALALGAALARGAWRQGDRPGALASLSVMAALVAICTYYVGRAVPNNLTALTPLIAIGLLCFYRLAVVKGRSVAVGTALAAAFLLQAAAGFAAGQLAQRGQLPHWRPAAMDTRVRAAEPELQALMQSAQLQPDSPVVYYGFATAMPRDGDAAGGGSHGVSWLPVPLQLLEQPIPPAVQQRILDRYLHRQSKAGFIVQARGESEERFDHWRELLARTHREAASFDSPRFRIIRFEPRTVSGAP